MNSSTTNVFTRYVAMLMMGMAVLVSGLAVVALRANADTLPVISGTPVATPTDTGATVTWSTDQAGTSQVEYGLTSSYTASTTLNTASTTAHTSTLSGLTSGTLYHFAVVTGNASGTATSSDQTFTTTNTASTTASTSAPVISNINTTPTDTDAGITWTTDQAGTSQVLYGLTSSYSASSSLDSGFVTNHTSTITGLSPSTLYHFAVVTGNASGTVATSSDRTFTTASSTTATSTAPVISTVLATPTETGATISWNTDVGANTQVRYGQTTAYGNTTTLDPAQVTSHLVTLSGLTANTLYHFLVSSSASSTGLMASSTDMTFTTLMSTSTGGTGTTTGNDLTDLQNAISDLQTRVSLLEAEVAALMAGGGNTGSSTPTTSAGILDQSSMTTSSGGSINFGGRGFPHEEDITITLNGSKVGSAHADGGGNFSTGSITAPSTPGTYTYVFTGSTGDVTSATVTVQ